MGAKEDMKKILIVFFLVFLMLLAPMTSVAKTTNSQNQIKTTINDDIDPPKIFLSDEDQLELNTYINSNFQGDEQDQAKNIANNIVASDGGVDINELFDLLMLYGYPQINEEELKQVSTKNELNQLLDDFWGVKNGVFTENIFGNLIHKIIDLIKGRLGWLHYFLDEGVNLFVKGVRIIVNATNLPVPLLVALVAVANRILSIPGYIADLVKDIFNLDFNEFVDSFIGIIEDFAADVVTLIEETKNFFQNITIRSYLNNLKGYFQWLETEPWKNSILVTGTVRYNGFLLKNADVKCRDKISKTDDQGRFSFYVQVSPSDDSLPANKWYGLHNCSITVSKDGKVLKNTPTFLSYVFSGGKIAWAFLVIKSKNKDKKISFPIFERICEFFEKIYIFFLTVFRKIKPITSVDF